MATTIAGLVSTLLAWRFWLGLHLIGILIGLSTLILGTFKRHALLASSGALVAIPLAWIVFEDVTTHDIWDWSSTMTAEVIVLDDKLGLPIDDASVTITWSIVDPDGTDAFTDAAGVANYSKDWPYGGRSSGHGLLYGGGPSYSKLRRHALHVSADGYKPFVQTLDKLTGMTRIQLPDVNLPSLTVRIERNSQGDE